MRIRIKLTQYIGFITIGLASSIVGPLLPVIRSDLNLDYFKAGLLLSGQFIGMFLTVILGGYLADRFGKKPFLLLGSLLLVIGLIGIMLSVDYNILFCFNLVSGVGFGIYEVGINSLCADYSESNKGAEMNYLHLFFGIGAVSGPILATFCLKTLENWRLTFGLTALFPIVVFIILYPLIENKKPADSRTKGSLIYKNWFIWAAGISIFMYVGIEVSVFNWMPTLWDKQMPKGIISASIIGTAFWGMLTLGRLFNGKISDRAGFPKYIILSSFFALITIIFWWIFPVWLCTLLVIMLCGLALAGIFPTIMASVTSLFPGDSGKVVALISIFASLGGFLMPLIIGYLADSFGIVILPGVMLVLSLLMVLSTCITWGVLVKKQ